MVRVFQDALKRVNRIDISRSFLRLLPIDSRQRYDCARWRNETKYMRTHWSIDIAENQPGMQKSA